MMRMRVVAIAAMVAAAPAGVHAQIGCPPEVQAAKDALQARQVAGTQSAAPRQLVGSRTDTTEAPRAQDVQAPRSQDVQAPRSQDVQAPRSQDVQAPRS